MLSREHILDALTKIPGVADEPFYLVDVGCSGGIDSKWRCLPGPLRVVGFDPLEAEIERLNKKAAPGEIYEAAFVTSPKKHSEDSAMPRSFPLSSAAQVHEKMSREGQSYRQKEFNSGMPIRTTRRSLTLDEYFLDEDRAVPNFIKIDTDGFDFGVLEGATAVLSHPECIGVQIECQFHGSPFDDRANTFSHIDQLLRQYGFSLYRLEPWYYSRRALPLPFRFRIPAQTEGGPVDWGEALYFKDPWLRHPDALDVTSPDPLPAALLLALAVTEFPDVVAQLLWEAKEVDGERDVEEALDSLVAGNAMGARNHREYLEIFANSPEKWFPSAAQKMFDSRRQRLARWLLGRKGPDSDT